MKKTQLVKLCLFLFYIIATVDARAQVGIGTTTPDASAELDVNSNTKGFLPPRMDLTHRNAISSPAAGLIVYNTTTNAVEVYNGIQWSSTAHYIGEATGGGIVFFVYDNGEHGLIAATINQSNVGVWGIDNSIVFPTSDGIGAGIKNTAQIANYKPSNQLAGHICYKYSVTVAGITYGDWYLPSKYELNLLYLQQAIVGNFNSGTYWSSNVDPTYQNNAFVINFINGNLSLQDVQSSYGVRAIRSF